MGFLDDTVVSEMEYDVAVISSSRASENWLFAADVMVLRRWLLMVTVAEAGIGKQGVQQKKAELGR